MNNDQPSVGEICHCWWQEDIAEDIGSARRTRAELRRASTPLEVLGISAVHNLNQKLASEGYRLRNRADGPDRLALIAMALASVKKDTKDTAARRFGAGDPKLLNPIRFNALIRAEAPRDLARPLVRALAMIEDGVSVRKLANDLYWWNNNKVCDVRTDWCFDYYGATGAMPNVKGEEAKT